MALKLQVMRTVRETIEFNPSDYDYLPPNFQPPQDGSAGFRFGKQALLDELPMPLLPNGLIPKRGYHIQPPRFHFGWAFTPDEFYVVAARCGFAVRNITPLPPDVTPSILYLDTYRAKKELANILRDKLGIHTCSPDFNIVYPKKGHISISLTNNYKRGNRRPPDEDVQAIQKFFGLEEPAGWFLEAEAYRQWGPRFMTCSLELQVMRTARQTISFNPSDYDYLPPNFQPPQDGSAGFRFGKEALLDELPMPFLPNGLIPKLGYHIQPPRFHFGWAFTPDEFYVVAARCGFAVRNITPLPPDVTPSILYLDTYRAKKELAKILREKLGIHTCSPDFNILYPKKGHISISLTNNYKRGNRRPPDEDVQAIQKFFGLEEPAGWFLEAEAYRQWGPRLMSYGNIYPKPSP